MLCFVFCQVSAVDEASTSLVLTPSSMSSSPPSHLPSSSLFNTSFLFLAALSSSAPANNFLTFVVCFMSPGMFIRWVFDELGQEVRSYIDYLKNFRSSELRLSLGSFDSDETSATMTWVGLQSSHPLASLIGAFPRCLSTGNRVQSHPHNLNFLARSRFCKKHPKSIPPYRPPQARNSICQIFLLMLSVKKVKNLYRHRQSRK